MAQKKNKNSKHQNQKVVIAQKRNEFFRKLKFVIDATCGKHIYPLIPKNILDDTYLNRCSSFKFVADHNSHIPEQILTWVETTIKSFIKKDIVKLHGCDIGISLNDYYTIYMNVVILHVLCMQTEFPQAPLLRETFDQLITNQDKSNAVGERMFQILFAYNWYDSDLRKSLYWCKREIVSPKRFPNLTENIITVYSVAPETIHVKIDGIARPAIRLGWAIADSGSKWLRLKPSQLGIKNAFAEIPLDVYIQSHALNRLSERVDCFCDGIVQFNLYNSLQNPVVTHDANNKPLIEYLFFQNKAGYLRADIVNGIILIRTFLFITNNGTPEGRKIEKNTGLQLLDKKYLEIDKLSTFMNSDLDTNEAAKEILISCGCKSLIDLFGNMKFLVTKKDNGIHFDSMLAYMDVNKSSISLNEEERVVESV